MLSVALALVAAAQSAAPIIEEVVIRNAGVGTLDEPFIRTQTTVRAGQRIDRAAVARDVRSLLDTDRFSKVSVEYQEGEKGVRLVYSVRGKARLAGEVDVSIVPQGRKPLLKVSLVRKLLALEAGDLVDDQVLGVRVQAVRDEYRRRYSPNTTVRWQVEPIASGSGLARVSVTVEEGPRIYIDRVEFVGNATLSSRLFRTPMGMRAWWNPLWFFGQKRYTEDDLALAQSDIRRIYLERGFLDVRVDMPTMAPDEEGRTVITVRISEGRQYCFGGFSFQGASAIPEEQLRAVVRLEQGAVASIGRVEESVDAVQRYYRGRGYLRTAARPMLDAREDAGRVNVVFAVHEGPQKSVRNVSIQGNTRTRDKVIRRELLVYPGEILNEIRVERTERRLRNLGFFSEVQSFYLDTPVPENVDVVFRVKEQPSGQLMLGAGFSSIDNLVGFLEISQGNFDIGAWPPVGGGQKLKLRAELSSTREEYRLSFVEPWFLDRKLALGLEVYRRGVDYEDYQVDRLGAAISVTPSLPYGLRLNLRYGVEDVSDIGDTSAYTLAETGELVTFSEPGHFDSEFGVTLSRDTRDHPFFPSRGTKVSLGTSLMGGPLGGDTDLYRASLGIRQYFTPWYGHVLMLRTQYDVVAEFDDTASVPYSERLFVGGGRTLRGFDYREVGPKALPVAGGRYREYGGRSRAFATAEYSIPLSQEFRIATFYDIGGAWLDPYEFQPESMASSYGVGLRLNLPGFPIRIDRAWVLERDDDLTEEDTWTVWIGYDF